MNQKTSPKNEQDHSLAYKSIGKEVALLWAALFKNIQMYDPNNEIFQEPLQRLRKQLHSLISREGHLSIEASQSEIFVNRNRLRLDLANLTTFRFFISEFLDRKLGGLSFDSPPEIIQIQKFLKLFAAFRAQDEQTDCVELFNTQLHQAGLNNLRALPAPEPEDDQSDHLVDRRERAITSYEQALDFLRESISTLDSPEKVSLSQAKRVVHSLVDLSYEDGGGFSLAGLASIKSHDEYTFNHMVNVCVLAIAFGQRLGFSRLQLSELGLCGLYHDIGKIHIPLDVLNKPGKFTPEEWATMGNHTIFAARTLLKEGFDYSAIKRILCALQHHLRFDGTGYPDLKILKKQSLFTRIISIIDTYDAMTTKRVYQGQKLPHQAMEVLNKFSGTFYDPVLVKAFINCMGIFPVGSLAIMTSGELAVIVESCADPQKMDRPWIRIITDRQQQLCTPRTLDLSLPESDNMQISSLEDPEDFNINISHFIL